MTYRPPQAEAWGIGRGPGDWQVLPSLEAWGPTRRRGGSRASPTRWFDPLDCARFGSLHLGGLAQPRLLLHLCCAPCSTHVVEVLREHFQVAGHFYNPNIHPEEEYQRRALEMRGYARRIGLPLLVSDYDTERWREAVRGLEAEPEGGRRCLACYRLRLEETAALARRDGFTHFTTSLSLSPHKRAEAINAVGREVAARRGLEFYAADFKKRDGFAHSLRLSREAGLYRQDYCGCEFSLEERERRKERVGQRQ